MGIPVSFVQVGEQEGTATPPTPHALIAEMPFALGGALTVRESGRWYPPADAPCRSFLASLRVAGSTTTFFTVSRNGSVILSGSLASGVTKVTGDISGSPTLGRDADYLTVACTGVGSGAQDLVIQVRFS